MRLTTAVIYLLLFKTFRTKKKFNKDILLRYKRWWSRKQGGIHTQWFGLTWAKRLSLNTKYSSSKEATQATVTEVMSAHGRALGAEVTCMLCPRNLSQYGCYSSQVAVTHGSLPAEAENRINSCDKCVNNGELSLTSKSLTWGLLNFLILQANEY